MHPAFIIYPWSGKWFEQRWIFHPRHHRERETKTWLLNIKLIISLQPNLHHLLSFLCFTCPRGCKVTLVAFVWLFSAVCFKMCPQSVCIRGCPTISRWFIRVQYILSMHGWWIMSYVLQCLSDAPGWYPSQYHPLQSWLMSHKFIMQPWQPLRVSRFFGIFLSPSRACTLYGDLVHISKKHTFSGTPVRIPYFILFRHCMHPLPRAWSCISCQAMHQPTPPPSSCICFLRDNPPHHPHHPRHLDDEPALFW